MGDHKDKNDISFLLLKTCFFVQDSVKPTSHKEQEHERVVLKSNEYNMLTPKKKCKQLLIKGHGDVCQELINTNSSFTADKITPVVILIYKKSQTEK